jgi:trehalose 2-sulfotransferase
MVVVMESSPRISALLCTLPRSGSWLLAEYLHNSDRAGTPEEYFRPDYVEWYLSRWGAPPGRTITEYLRLCRARTATDNGVFSVKLHWYQMEWLVALLRVSHDAGMAPHEIVESEFPHVRYIYLIREDTASQALSWYRAIRTDAWFQLGEEGRRPYNERPDLQQVRWLEDVLLDHGQRWCSYFRAAGVSPLCIRFADLVQRPDPTVRRVLAHMDAGYPSGQPLPRGRLARQSDEWTDFWQRAYLQVREALPHRDASVRWSPAHNRFIRLGADEGEPHVYD